MQEILKNFPRERKDLIFFFVFLWLIPFGWRKVLWMYPPPGSVGFNEYTDISLYIGDVFLVLAVLIYILEHRNIIKSMYRERKFHVERYSWLSLPSLLVILAFISVFYANQKPLAFYSAVKLLEMVVLFSYVFISIIPRETKEVRSTWNTLKTSLLIVVLSGIFQSLIGIIQFLKQSSLGISFLGESVLGRDLPGIAKVIYQGEVFVRAYGTFPHPNILGGFLFFALFSLIFLQKSNLFHVKRFFYGLAVFILMLGIIVTFSKSAYLATIIGFLLFPGKDFLKNALSVPRGTKIRLSFSLFHVKHLFLIFSLLFILAIVFLQDHWALGQSFGERWFLFIPTLLEILRYPFFGQGIGQFVYSLPSMMNLLPWQLQPIHDIYLLIAFELGLIGLGIILFFIWKLIQSVPRGTFGRFSLAVLSGFLFIGLVDHYLWDIQAGQILLWIALALSASSLSLTKEENIV